MLLTTSKKKKRIYPMRRTHELHSIKDLIELTQRAAHYDHINMDMLYNITPQLIEIENMIGMCELKRTLFYQIIYYLQDLNIEKSKDYLHTVILGPPGSGKCLAKDTLILSENGFGIFVQDLKIGDKILGDDKVSRTILSTCQGTETMYTIKTPTLEYTVNESHQLSFQHVKSGEKCEFSVKDYLELKDKNSYVGYKIGFQIKPIRVLAIDPYVWGYRIGSINKGDSSKKTCLIRFSNTDIQAYFESFSIVYPTNYCHYFALDLLYFRGYEEFETALNCSSEDRYYILAGLLDACAVYNEIADKMTFYVEVSDTLILRLCDSLAIAYQLNTHALSYTMLSSRTRDLFYQCVTIDNVSFNIPSFLCKTGLPKREQVHTFPIDIVKVGEGEYYGFECDGNGRFLLYNGTVTHNTSIARIIGEMYKNMDVLSRDGIFKIAKREDFVAEFLGQTAIKTRKLLNECKGGVLFIDEVYALGPGNNPNDTDSFSKEAVDTLNVFLSENSHLFCCIIAGYEEDVKRCFFSINQGLERRFQWVHRVGDYSSENLVDIFIKLVHESSWYCAADRSFIHNCIHENPELFKSLGGAMENLFTKCKMMHAKRRINRPQCQKFEILNTDITEAIKVLKPNQLNRKEKTNHHLSMYI